MMMATVVASQDSPLSATSKNMSILVEKKKKQRVGVGSPPLLPSLSSSSSPLHEACLRGADLTLSELKAILQQDPEAARRPIRLSHSKHEYNNVLCEMKERKVYEPYQYALNLAIYYKASSEVLTHLVASAPEILAMRDRNSCSLHILLRHKPTDSVTADSIILTQPEILKWQDSQQGNTALHTAVSTGLCALQTIRHLVLLHPDALRTKNYHGQTPIDIALGGSCCAEEVVSYLLQEFKTMI